MSDVVRIGTESPQARRLVISGRVQGVGFRPFVYRLAQELDLLGSVHNGAGKVLIHAEGQTPSLDEFEHRLISDAPPLARPELSEARQCSPAGHADFHIDTSRDEDEPEIHIPPDLFTCDDCVEELLDPRQRRHAYPFINCTQCGPRYTIITSMPYDRPNTSMGTFELCRDCRAEYESPLDRRFHAQPLACPRCGPTLEFHLTNSREKHIADRALEHAVNLLNDGQILAVKGIGGYHLMCDAANSDAVNRLRRRKQRPHKPLAVMFPMQGTDGLTAIRQELGPGKVEALALADPARPIVLTRKRKSFALSPELAPGLHELGAFLPYSPLHHWLLRAAGKPLVATSGNISGEPVLTCRTDATSGLSAIVDGFLHHNREIVRPADDSVARVIDGRVRPIRLGRGNAPTELALPFRLDVPVLATGGHMKNTVALGWDQRAVISPHVGELDSPRSRKVFEQVITDLQGLYGVKAKLIACDRHPEYHGHRWAQQSPVPVIEVQHHAAHASSLAGEFPGVDSWLMFTWDGVGLGPDSTLWGGEALAGRPGQWSRISSFRTFDLVGGDRAGRQPWRSAGALLWAEEHDWLPGFKGANLAQQAWLKGVNTHRSSAVGRLFDAAACLVLGCKRYSFEGQGPMQLEQAATQHTDVSITLPLEQDAQGIWRADWAPLLPMLADDRLEASFRAGVFHRSLAGSILDQACRSRETHDFEAVGLTGGVFQNRLLTEMATSLLEANGFVVHLHEQVPANDGGLSFGQLIEAGAMMNRMPELTHQGLKP